MLFSAPLHTSSAAGMGLNPVLLVADHLAFISLDVIAPTSLSCRLRL
jgi:hypothetical protein